MPPSVTSGRQSSISSVSMDAPISTLRARFGLKHKSSRQSLSGSVNGMDDTASSRPEDGEHVPESTIFQVSSSGARPAVPIIAPTSTSGFLRADQRPAQTGSSKNASTQWPKATAPIKVSHSGGRPQRIRESPATNLDKKIRSTDTSADSLDRIASAEPNARRLSRPQSEVRQTVSANTSARRSFLPDDSDGSQPQTIRSIPQKALQALIPASSVGTPPSSPGNSSTGTQKLRPCHGCNDAGAYRMKQFMVPCSTCWRKYHPDCMRWRPKELVLLQQRKLPPAVGDPGWICRVCLQKNRRPASSRPAQSLAPPPKDAAYVNRSRPRLQTMGDRKESRPVYDNTNGMLEEDVIPSIEPASSHDGSYGELPTTKLKRKRSLLPPMHVQRLRVAKSPGRAQAPYTSSIMSTSEKSTEQAGSPVRAPTATHEQRIRKELSMNSTSKARSTSAVTFVRAPTEALLAEAVGDTLKDPFEDNVPGPDLSSVTAKLLDKHEREEMLPDIDTTVVNDTDDNNVSSSDKQRQDHASLPSPASLASVNEEPDALAPKPISLNSTNQSIQRLPSMNGDKASTQPTAPVTNKVSIAEPTTPSARTDFRTSQTGSLRQAQARPVSIVDSMLLTCPRCKQRNLSVSNKRSLSCAKCEEEVASGVPEKAAEQVRIATNHQSDRSDVSDKQGTVLSRPLKLQKLQDERLESSAATSAKDAVRVEVASVSHTERPDTVAKQGVVLSHISARHEARTQQQASSTTTPAETDHPPAPLYNNSYEETSERQYKHKSPDQNTSKDFVERYRQQAPPQISKDLSIPSGSAAVSMGNLAEDAVQAKAATCRPTEGFKVGKKQDCTLPLPSAAQATTATPANVAPKRAGTLSRLSATRKPQDNRRTTSTTTPKRLVHKATFYADMTRIFEYVPELPRPPSPTTPADSNKDIMLDEPTKKLISATEPGFTRMSLAELEREFGETHENTEDQLVKLITQALFSTPERSHEMLHREIVKWVVDNVATYQKDSSWEASVGKVLAAHSATAGIGSRKLWARSKQWTGDVHPWKLLNPTAVKQRWDSFLRRYVSTPEEQVPQPSTSALFPRKPATLITKGTPSRIISCAPPIAVMVTPSPASGCTETLIDAMTGIDTDKTTATGSIAESDDHAVHEGRPPESERRVVHKDHPAESDEQVVQVVHGEPPPAAAKTKVNPTLAGLMRHALSTYTMATDSSPSQIRPLDQAIETAMIAKIARRRTRKQMFGEPASESRLDQPVPFVPGLSAESKTASNGVTSDAIRYNADPFAATLIKSHGEREEVQYVDIDELDEFFGAPRDMIMTISGGDLAWRDMPRAGEGVRTRPKMIAKVGKSS